MLPVLLAALAVPRVGPGRARTRPEALLGDKAYSSRSHRALLRRRGIKAVIPEPADQIGHRLRKGSRGGLPVSYNRDPYKHRNVIERGFNAFKQWRGLASRYDKLAVNYRGGALLRAIRLRAPLDHRLAGHGGEVPVGGRLVYSSAPVKTRLRS